VKLCFRLGMHGMASTKTPGKPITLRDLSRSPPLVKLPGPLATFFKAGEPGAQLKPRFGWFSDLRTVKR
jgi:hypothetical protein